MTNKTRCLVTREILPWEKCLACSANQDRPNCPFSYALLKRLADEASNERTGIHVTALVGCLRRSAYQQILATPTPYPHHKLVPLIGTATHKFLEGAPDVDALTELPVAHDYDGVTVVGTVDYFNPRTGLLLDMKTVRGKAPSALPYPEQKAQVQIYANILTHMGYTVKRAALQFIDLDGPSRCPSCDIALEPGDNALQCPRCDQDYPLTGYHLGAFKFEVPLRGQWLKDSHITQRAKALSWAIEGLDVTLAQPAPGPLCRFCAFREECEAAE